MVKSDVKRPEEFIHEYRAKQKNYSYYLKKKKIGEKSNDFDLKELIFVIRIKG